MTRTKTPAEAIGVVGAGAVGQAVTGALLAAGLSRRLLVCSRTQPQTAAWTTDLEDMRQALTSPVHPYGCRVKDLRECTAVVIALRASFTNTNTSDVRLAGASANAPSVRALAEALRGYGGTVLMVTNPVDLMSRLFADVSACKRVFGIGSNLDSARYRAHLARLLDVPAHAVSGRVIGEHGDAAVVCASTTTVNRRPVTVPLQAISEELRTRPARISDGIGRTRLGPTGSVLSALRKTLGCADGVEELSAPYRGGWLGIPLRFTAGQPLPCLPVLNGTEQQQFAAADTKLRAAYQALRGNSTPVERIS
ncbi:lactate dehydrogenase [Streptomyces sp. NPDC004296]|uniref:lactate/malate family dehydrogenase n=1 Tax=Streptomyces sp. NPDC004296 TaxID=3364697 RepID=UPI0036CC2047